MVTSLRENKTGEATATGETQGRQEFHVERRRNHLACSREPADTLRSGTEDVKKNMDMTYKYTREK